MEEKKIKESILQKSNKTLIYRYIVMINSLFVTALLYNLLLQPTKIITGGVNGLAIINKYLNGINPSLTIFIISIVMLILSYIYLGRKRTTGTFVATFLYPLFIEITSNINQYIQIELTDLLVISIFIGVIGGLANGFLYKTGFSNGGLPIISQILFDKLKIPIGKTNFIINITIILLGSLFFGTNMIMYAIIILYINSLIVDKIILGNSNNKAIYIFTSKEEEIKDFLIKDMNHTATLFDVRGAYLNKKRKMILTVVPTTEYFQVTESIKLLDPQVFYLVNNAYEVKGGK
ncbi:MAG: YitT family protein [Bacilli bacterium]|nr:YitT family protein [Bacilli bacterium]